MALKTRKGGSQIPEHWLSPTGTVAQFGPEYSAVFNARPVKETVTEELLDWGRLLPSGNREMVKLLRLCVDYGEEKILSIKHKIPPQIIPTVDMVRSYLCEPLEQQVIYLNREIPILQTDLTQYECQVLHGCQFG